jgi:cytochrome c-type biogenesis protein CcmH
VYCALHLALGSAISSEQEGGTETIVRIRLVFAILSLAAALSAQTGGERQARVLKLESSLLAPCCWAESVSTHRSEVALQMREEIAAFVNAGKTDQEVRDYYKQKYGLRILVEPEGALWWWMHVIPFVVLGIGAVVVVFLLKKWLRPLPAS